MEKFTVIDDFQARDHRVLVLDRDCINARGDRLIIDGVEYEYAFNSIRNWVIIKSTECFVGKQIYFA